MKSLLKGEFCIQIWIINYSLHFIRMKLSIFTFTGYNYLIGFIGFSFYLLQNVIQFLLSSKGEPPRRFLMFYKIELLESPEVGCNVTKNKRQNYHFAINEKSAMSSFSQQCLFLKDWSEKLYKTRLFCEVLEQGLCCLKHKNLLCYLFIMRTTK